MILHYNLQVTGLVQRVGFRFMVNLEANRNNLHGFVRNEADGSVYIEVEGEDEKLSAFVEWCRTGAPPSEVTHVEIKKSAVVGYSDFVIRH